MEVGAWASVAGGKYDGETGTIVSVAAQSCKLSIEDVLTGNIKKTSLTIIATPAAVDIHLPRWRQVWMRCVLPSCDWHQLIRFRHVCRLACTTVDRALEGSSGATGALRDSISSERKRIAAARLKVRTWHRREQGKRKPYRDSNKNPIIVTAALDGDVALVELELKSGRNDCTQMEDCDCGDSLSGCFSQAFPPPYGRLGVDVNACAKWEETEWGCYREKSWTWNKDTALSMACSIGHLPLVQLLLARGANPRHKVCNEADVHYYPTGAWWGGGVAIEETK